MAPDRVAVLVITLAGFVLPWAILFTALPPAAQDFPLGDDWAFARGALAFARGEGIHYSGWASMPLLGQWVWAYPFIRVLGPSHVTLRLATIVLTWLGTLAFYDLARREIGLTPAAAAFAAVALALNPFYFWLTATFMSDQPALAFALLALAAYARAFAGRTTWLLPAAAVATLACVTRQNAVAAPLAAGLLLARRPGVRGRPAYWVAVLVPLAAGVGAALWFGSRPDIIPRAPRLPSVQEWFLEPFFVLHTLGLAVLPALAWAGSRTDSRWYRAGLVYLAGAVAFCWAGFGYPALESRFPYAPGPVEPAFAYTWGAPTIVPVGRSVAIVLTVAGCLAGAALFARVMAPAARPFRAGMLAAFTGFHLLILAVAPFVNHRYLLPALPGALAVMLAGGAAGRVRQVVGLVALAVAGAVAVAGTHDWLAANSARWRLGRRAVAAGIPATAIEGGFEWDGWNAPVPVRSDRLAEAMTGPNRPAVPDLAIHFNRTLFPELKGSYGLAFEQLPGTVTLDAEPFTLWLSWGPHSCYLIRPARGTHGDGGQHRQ